MPIHLEFRHADAGIILNCSGILGVDDFHRANQAILDKGEDLKKWLYSIVDLTFVESMTLAYEQMPVLLEQDKKMAALATPGLLVALCSSRDLGFGLARMWESLVEPFGWDTQVFRSRMEAEDWVRKNVKLKFGMDLADSSAADSST
jgi:hypothetical protein